jgi:hypothetical protein
MFNQNEKVICNLAVPLAGRVYCVAPAIEVTARKRDG